MKSAIAATVAGVAVPVAEIDAREARLRGSAAASALPHPNTSEGRQLRRWLTQLVTTEHVIAAEAAAMGVPVDAAPSESDVMADAAARHDIGSVAAAVLTDPLARAVFAYVTAAVTVGEEQIATYHARYPWRFAERPAAGGGWQIPAVEPPALERVRPAITRHLLSAARRRAFRHWLDARCAACVVLAPGYEHPGDPRQPDNTHRH